MDQVGLDIESIKTRLTEGKGYLFLISQQHTVFWISALLLLERWNDCQKTDVGIGGELGFVGKADPQG